MNVHCAVTKTKRESVRTGAPVLALYCCKAITKIGVSPSIIFVKRGSTKFKIDKKGGSEMGQLFRIFIYLAGMSLNFLGGALFIKSTLGAGFWTAMVAGIKENLGLTVGFWYGFSQLAVMMINSYLVKRRPEIEAVITLVLEALILDFWLEVALRDVHLGPEAVVVKATVFTAGVLLMSLGVSLYIMPGFPRAPVDQLFLTLSEKFRFSIRISQTVVAASSAAIGLLIGGPVGIGTVLVVLAIGPLIQFWYPKVERFYTVNLEKHQLSRPGKVK